MQIQLKLASESHVPRFRAGVGTWQSGYMIPIRLPWRHRARPSATLHEILSAPKGKLVFTMLHGRVGFVKRDFCNRIALPFGVVSLHEMLDFPARDYTEIVYLLGLTVAKFSPEMDAPNFGRVLTKLLTDADRLGLTVTRDTLWQLVDELLGANPGRMKVQRQGAEIMLTGTDLNISSERLRHHAESIYSILRSELSAITFKAIPKEKARYANPKWLLDTPYSRNIQTRWMNFKRRDDAFLMAKTPPAFFT